MTSVALGAALSIAVLPASAANADTYAPGPVDLASAAPFAVLGDESVTNTGPSRLYGDLGLFDGTSITGFDPQLGPGQVLPPGERASGEVSALAQDDLESAYGVAAGLPPASNTVYDDLVGLTLAPGVYRGGELSLSGTLTLGGSADSFWVFQPRAR